MSSFSSIPTLHSINQNLFGSTPRLLQRMVCYIMSIIQDYVVQKPKAVVHFENFARYCLYSSEWLLLHKINENKYLN